ncbi:PREDICTED: dynein assembly factor with WDR repeat domains 1-like [Habropoda laboriosa]|uniref:dynein assembly factor with WDR repeat domains 1-like n=1 Tax=Habropoda laboriosa TaxID=597456 RepID=UPI00083E5C10|nr:PREDICTED: dynein assembly factor with WDR repeat domains 1-like [Habropoda laboriosa]
MKLLKFLLRYFPPGLALEYTQGQDVKTKMIDLLDLSAETDIRALAESIKAAEPVITENVMEQLVETLQKLQAKVCDTNTKRYYKYKTLHTHLLPLTNVAFDKLGKRCLTGSYDRTCKVWDIDNGTELLTLEGHQNAVYTVSFNNTTSDKILTGSFDKTAKVWCSRIGHCLQTMWGHDAQVVVAKFSPNNSKVATGSMDMTSKIFQLATGDEMGTLRGHTAEIVALHFNNDGSQIITGSFDGTVSVWDTRTFGRTSVLIGHRSELSNCVYNFDCSLIASSSMDKTVKVWDTRMNSCLATLREHEDEVLDVTFDNNGKKLATASSDTTARVWDVSTNFQQLALMKGHREEVSKGNPSSQHLLTSSSDGTSKLWSVKSGCCIQVLDGHTDDVFSCAFSYDGDTIITASKDNTCMIWR